MEKSVAQKVSLEIFIRDNEQLLTVLGVFGALVGLSGSLQGALSSFILSFAFVGGLILVWFELWYKLPKEDEMAPRLSLFRYVLLWSGTGLILYWLVQFRIFWHVALFIPVTVLVLIFFLSKLNPILEGFALTRAIFGLGKMERNIFQKIAASIANFIIFIVCLDVGVYLALGTNFILDGMKHLGW